MLSGTFIVVMGADGQVVMPKPLRAGLGVPFVLTRAPWQRLLAFPAPEWEDVVSRYEHNILFRGYYLSTADERTGRFRVPGPLREHAGLRPEDEVVISGLGRVVEISGRPGWEERGRQGERPGFEPPDGPGLPNREEET